MVVIDFGLAKAKVARDKRLHDFVGTLYSMAPEVLRGEAMMRSATSGASGL